MSTQNMNNEVMYEVTRIEKAKKNFNESVDRFAQRYQENLLKKFKENPMDVLNLLIKNNVPRSDELCIKDIKDVTLAFDREWCEYTDRTFFNVILSFGNKCKLMFYYFSPDEEMGATFGFNDDEWRIYQNSTSFFVEFAGDLLDFIENIQAFYDKEIDYVYEVECAEGGDEEYKKECEDELYEFYVNSIGRVSML